MGCHPPRVPERSGAEASEKASLISQHTFYLRALDIFPLFLRNLNQVCGRQMFFDRLTATRPKGLSVNMLLQLLFGIQALHVPHLDFVQYSEMSVRVGLDAHGACAKRLTADQGELKSSVPRTQGSGCISMARGGFESVPVHSGGEALTEESLSITEDYCCLEKCDNAKINLRSGEY